MSVNYSNNLISVSFPRDKNLLVYAHPHDKISFDFDISDLDKEIINGDLIIRLLNGGTITVVNFGLMALDNKAPILEDINKSYNPFTLFNGYAYYDESGVSNLVISREISSPDNKALAPGQEYPTSKEEAQGISASSKEVGDFMTPEQSAIPEFAPLVQDYILKTFQHAYNKTYEVPVVYQALNNFRHNEIDSDVLPVKLLLINPKITPEYGTFHYLYKDKAGSHIDYEDLHIFIGGGRLTDEGAVEYLYKPEVIKYDTKLDKIWFDGPKQSNDVVRFFHVGVPSQTISVTHITITGLPAGVRVPEKLDDNINTNFKVKPLGAGAFEITIEPGRPGGVEIPMVYPLGMGGSEGIFSVVGVSYEGIQTKTGDLVRGGNISYFEFKPVRSEDDISNFTKFNTYTFSTLRDPLIIYFGLNGDVIKGGRGDYTYYGVAGDNIAYGGEATEVFHLGSGNNCFYVGVGNDTVDVDDVKQDNRLYLSDGINKADLYTSTTVLDNGKIWFAGKYNGKDFKSSIQDFRTVYFDIGDKGHETIRDDFFSIFSTKNLKDDILIDLGQGNNTVAGYVNAMYIVFKSYEGAKKLPFIVTDGTAYGAFIKWGSGTNRIIGSSSDDYIQGVNDSESFYFDGKAGNNTADYSGVTVDLTYDASTGIFNKSGKTAIDTVIGVQKIIGSATATNVFYGSVYYANYEGKVLQSDITYVGGSRASQSTLSYERLQSSAADKGTNGVIIDMVTCNVTKIKTGGKDNFYNIDNLFSSNNNDTFIISADVKSSNFNGLEGFNTIDYSRLGGVNVVFRLTQDASGTVTKGNGSHGVDVINNFRHFIGSYVGSSFILNDHEFTNDRINPYRFIVEGNGNTSGNAVNYSSISSKNIELDLMSTEVVATLYKGTQGTNARSQDIIGKDKLINIGIFSLTTSAQNTVYMYDVKQLNYVIDAGANGNNALSFAKSNSAVNIDFNNGDYKNNLLNIKLLQLSNANNNIVMGSGFFAEEIDGGNGVSFIDFSFLIVPIVTEIDLNFIELKQVNIGSKVIKVKNFQHIKATNADDNFTIKFDLKDVDNLKNKDIVLMGSQGFNTIAFREVKDSGNMGNGLTIDLSSLSEAVVTDGKGSKILKFSEFESIIGSLGNDTFILPSVSFTFMIDGYTSGPDASNAVSYQMYTKGVYITELVLNKFRNIQKIIGSQGNDFITLTEKTNLQVDGFGGFNSAIYKSTAGAAFDFPINVDILENSLEVIKNVGGGKLVDILRKVNLVSFAEVSGPQGVTFTVKNKSNNAFASDGKLFLSGVKRADNGETKDKIDYSSLGEGVILNLDVQKDLEASGYWINVDKGNNSIDYLKNIGSIKLSDKSKVNVYNSIAAFSDVKVLNIDGISDSSLSFANYISDVRIDVTKASMKFSPTLTINFSGFTSYEGTNGYNFTSYFLSSDNKQYHFNGLSSNSTLSYKEVVGNIKVFIKADNNKGNYNILSIEKANYKDTALNITTVEGSKGSTTIEIEDNINTEMQFIGTKGDGIINSISYEKINNVELLSFLISKTGTTVGKIGGLFNDKIVNFTSMKGSKGNTRFDVDVSVLTGGLKYTLDGGGGYNSINLSAFNVDLTLKLESEKNYISVLNGATTLLDIYNMHFIWGSYSNKNNFILGNIFNGKYFASPDTLTLYGSKTGKDVLDLTDTDKSLILEPLSGRIYLNEKSYTNLIAGVGISTINLGSGNHQLDISSKVISTSWKVINGGTGKNSVSFAKMLSGITYDLDKGMQDIGITLTNFTGVTGSLGNDIFTLTNSNKVASMINGNGGSLNTLDFSKINVKIKVDIPNNQVTRGNITDTVLNMQVFKTGSGGANFISQFKGSYQFIGDASAVSNNTLSYAGIDENITFNFITQSIIKGIGNNYDKFQNIGKLIGGSKTNNFLFVTEGLAPNLTTIILDGGVGINNIVNLSQLKKGITFDIASKSFTVPYNNGTLTIKLENIHQVIGTAEADIFIFSDSINNFMANGGINKPGVKDTIDLSKVTSSVIVDFAYRTISYGNNKNHFLNIDKFIGSSVGNNLFKGLSTNSSYDIDGGASPGSEGNTINYSGASVGLSLSVSNGKFFINKGGLSDTFKNIHNLVLTNLEDNIIFNEAGDLNVYKSFKKIDGGIGNNTVIFTGKSTKENDITINLATNVITIGALSQSLALLNFHSWVFNEGTKTYTIIVGEKGLNLNTIVFAKSEANGVLNIKDFAADLSVMVDQNSNSTIIINSATSTRTTIINLKNLVLGNQTYNFTYSSFDPNKFMFNVTTAEKTSFNVDINYYNSDQAITLLNNKIQLGKASFQNLNNLSIGGFAGNRLNIELKELSARKNNLIVHDIAKEKLVSFTSSVDNCVVNFIEGQRFISGTKDVKALEATLRNVENSEIILTKATTLAFSTFFPVINVARSKASDAGVTIDLSELPFLNNGTIIKITSNKDISLYIKASNKAFFTLDSSNKNLVVPIIGSIYNDDTFEVTSDSKINITENGSSTNSLIIIPTAAEVNNKDFIINISYNKVASSSNLLNVNIAGNRGINRINLKVPNEVELPKYQVNVTAYNNLEYVGLGRSAVVSIDFRANSMNNISGTLNLASSTLGGQSVHMLSGKFNSVNSSLTIENALVKEGGNFLIRFGSGNNSIILNSPGGNKIDFSTVKNFKLTVDCAQIQNLSNVNSFSFGNYVNSKGFSFKISSESYGNLMAFNGITLKNVNAIHLQVSNASDKAIVNKVEINNLSEGSYNALIDFGSFSNMKLPTYYQIPIYSQGHSQGLGGSYPTLAKGEERMSGYQNRVIFYENIVNGNLFVNSNNECIIQGENGNRTFRLIGVNYIKFKTVNIKINELALAKPFMIQGEVNQDCVFDLSNVRDGQVYSFKIFASGDANSIGMLIYSTNKVMDKFSPKDDPSFKLYGSINDISYVILPSCKNYINIDVPHASHSLLKVDGGNSDSTLIYNIRDVGSESNNRIKISQEGGGSIIFTNVDEKTIYYNINKIVVPEKSHPYINFNSGDVFRKGNQAYTFDIDTSKKYERLDGVRLVNDYKEDKYAIPAMLFSGDKVITTAYSFTGNDINPVIICNNFFLDRLSSNSIKVLTLSNILDFNVINKNYPGFKTMQLDYNMAELEVVAPALPDSTNYNVFIESTNNQLIIRDKSSAAYIKIHGKNFKLKKLIEADYQEHMLNMQHFLKYTQEYNKAKEYETSIGGSKLINSSNVWESESQYLEYFNKNSTTTIYWNNLDERINSAFEQKYSKVLNTSQPSTNSENNPNLDISSQLVYGEDIKEADKNTNHSSVDNISYEEESPKEEVVDSNDNEEGYYTEEDNEFDSINHGYTLIEESTGDNASDLESSNSIAEEFILPLLLEYAKKSSENEDNSYILEELGSNNVNYEVIEDMYQVDEANSMAYMVDTGSNAFFSDINLDNHNDTSNSQEQQKQNKY